MKNYKLNPETLVTLIPANEKSNRYALRKFKKEVRFLNCLARCLEKTRNPIYANPGRVIYEYSDEDASHLHIRIKNTSNPDQYLPLKLLSFINKLNREDHRDIKVEMDTDIDLNYIVWNDQTFGWKTGLFVKIEGQLKVDMRFPTGSIDNDRLKLSIPFEVEVEHKDWIECNAHFDDKMFQELMDEIAKEIRSEIRNSVNNVEAFMKAFRSF